MVRQFTPTPELMLQVRDEFKYNMTRKGNTTPKYAEYDLAYERTHKFSQSYGLSNYEDTPWVAMWIKRPLDDVQNDPA